jgi:hypothetical protein
MRREHKPAQFKTSSDAGPAFFFVHADKRKWRLSPPPGLGLTASRQGDSVVFPGYTVSSGFQGIFMDGKDWKDQGSFDYPWQQAYLAALTETNPDQLLVKIVSAQCAIARRLTSHDPDYEEHLALEDAMRSLKSLFTGEKARRECEKQRREKTDAA